MRRLSLCAAMAIALAPVAFAQDADTEKAIEKYRAMLREDPWSNPGYLDADRGETLWTTKAGPKNASFEQCDLGKGPGKLEGLRVPDCCYETDADGQGESTVEPATRSRPEVSGQRLHRSPAART